MMIWTDALDDRLRQLAQKGLSASRIARELGEGFTKSSVNNRCRRKGITTAPAINGRFSHSTAAPKRRPPGGPRPLIELRQRQCRWPMGEPMDPPLLFCAKPTAGGAGPYCEAHTRLAARRRDQP